MAACKLLGSGIACGVTSIVMLLGAIGTDHWYMVDSTVYLQACPEKILLGLQFPWFSTFPTSVDNSASDGKSLSLPIVSKGNWREDNKNVSIAETGRLVRKPFYFFQNKKGYKSSNISTDAARLAQAERFFQITKHQSTKKQYHYYYDEEIKNKPRLKLQRLLKDVSSSMEKRAQPKPNLRKYQLQIFTQLVINLHAFAGRDIMSRRFHHYNRSRMLLPSKKNQSFREFPRCYRRQFSTVTGLWQTCYLPQLGSFLQKLIHLGNITRCASISYRGLDSKAIPDYLQEREREFIIQKEKESLYLRRSVVSFLFLGIALQLLSFGVVTLGWYRNEEFEQYAGGLVMLMSGILYLAGMCTHCIMCQFEMNRKPEDLYALPSSVVYGFGVSTYFAWGALSVTLLSSFLCTMAPLHKSTFPTSCYKRCPLYRPQSDSGMEMERQANKVVETAKIQKRIVERQSFSAYSTLSSNAALTETNFNAVDKKYETSILSRKKQFSITKMKSIHNSVNSQKTAVGKPKRLLSPIALVRTTTTARHMLENEQREANNDMRRKEYSLAQKRKFRSSSDIRLHHFNQRISFHQHSKNEQYFKKTRSLPREIR